MRPILACCALSAALAGAPPAKDLTFEVDMARVDGATCILVEGRWDEKGRAVITDRIMYNQYEPQFNLSYSVLNRIRVHYQSGATKDWPADIVVDGAGMKTWRAFYRTGEEEKFTRFRNLGGSPIVKFEIRGHSEGLQDCMGGRPPRLRIWDTPGQEVRWELANGCGFDPDVTNNDGLNWLQVERVNQGRHAYGDLAAKGPVVYRFLAYQGLNAYSFIYQAGKGPEPSPLRYLVDTVHQAYHPKGVLEGIEFNNFPVINFGGSHAWDIGEYRVTMRRIMHPELAPFDVARLCPSKFVQAIVAVNLDRLPQVDPLRADFGNNMSIGMDDRFFADAKENEHLNVYWVYLKDGVYVSKKLCDYNRKHGSMRPGKLWERDKEWYQRNEVYVWFTEMDPAQTNYYVVVAEAPPGK